MKVTICLENGKEIGLYDLTDALEPWTSANDNLSVFITPFMNIDDDSIEIVIIRKEAGEK